MKTARFLSLASQSWLRRIGQVWMLLLVPASVGWTQIPNDLFANRPTLSGLDWRVSASNVGATVEEGEPTVLKEMAGASVWWNWVAPETARFSLSTAGSDFDTWLGVFTGATPASLSLVAENDDEDLLGGIFTSKLVFAARAGTAYQIAVAGAKVGQDRPEMGAILLALEIAPQNPAPVWQTVDLDGRPIRSSDFQGKVVLLDFWATWCAPCRAEIPIFVELQEKYRERGLAILGVSVDTAGVAAVKQFMTDFGMNYPVFLTMPSLEAALGGIPSIPTAYLINRDGQLVERHVGFADRDFWENALLPLLNQPQEPIQLAIEAVGLNLKISWPAADGTFRLQTTSDLGRGSWGDVTADVVNRGGVNAVTLRPASAPSFFRLAAR